MAAAVGGVLLPSLSELHAWDVTHLQNAARNWTATAGLWEASFSSIHQAVIAPGGTVWEGAAAEAAQQSTLADLVKVRGWADVLHESAAIARRGADTLAGAKNSVLSVVEDAQAAGYQVGEDLSVTSPRPDPLSAARAQVYGADILERVAQLLAHDKEIATNIAIASAPLHEVTFADAPTPTPNGRNEIQLVDHRAPIPEAPNPAPEPPPGGWSSDPLERAAQKIAYGHAGTDHMADFPGMTRDQLADLIFGKMKRSIENPQGLRLGPSSSDGAPVIYDPKDNVLIVRDPGAADAGTVFRPNLEKDPNYVQDKLAGSVESFKPGQLADEPLPSPAEPPGNPGRPAEPCPPEPPVEPAPVEPPAPRPRLPEGFGGGLPGGIQLPGHPGALPEE